MPLKDYYQILEVEPQASDSDIRSSFRRLAKQFHPDRNPDDQVAAAHFREVQEAYDTLTDPYKKEIYLQQRWYEQSMGRRMTGMKALTPVSVLKDILHLDKYVSLQNPYHLDKAGLLDYLLQTLSPEAIELLRNEPDTDILGVVLTTTLNCARHLKPAQALALADRLNSLAGAEPRLKPILDKYLATVRAEHFWERIRIPILLVVSLLICYIFFRLS
jgi:DnaJ-domain-containing protein 1